MSEFDLMRDLEHQLDGARIANSLPPILEELRKAEDRTILEAIQALDRNELTPDRAQEAWITLRVQRRLRKKLETSVKLAEGQARLAEATINPLIGA